MLNSNLTDYISASTNIGTDTINNVLEKFVQYIEDGLKSQSEINLRGFGTFSSRLMPAGTKRNPRTGESVEVPERIKPRLKFSVRFVKDLQMPIAATPATPAPTSPTKTPTAPATPEAKPKGRGRRKTEPQPVAEAPVIPAVLPAATTPAPSFAPPPPPSAPPLMPPPPPPAVMADVDRIWWMYDPASGTSVSMQQSQLLSAGVTEESALWTEGSDWRKARDIPELGYLFLLKAS